MLIGRRCRRLFFQDCIDDMLNRSSAVILVQQVEDLIERRPQNRTTPKLVKYRECIRTRRRSKF